MTAPATDTTPPAPSSHADRLPGLPSDVRVLCHRFGVPLKQYLDQQRHDAVHRAMLAWPELLGQLDGEADAGATAAPTSTPSPSPEVSTKP